MKRSKQQLMFAACFVACVGVGRSASPNMPSFFSRRDYTGLTLQSVQIGDTNGDGIPDLIVTNGVINVLFGNGDGTFRPGPSSLSRMLDTVGFATADVNGDGELDLVFAGGLTGVNPPQGIGVCLGNGDGTFQAAVFYQAGSDSEIYNVVLGDFDGDGIADAAIAGTSGIWLFRGRNDGTFGPGVLSVALAAGGGALATIDFNGDARLDLVVTLPYAGSDGSGDGFVVLFGNGNGSFRPPRYFTTPQRPLGLAVGILTKGGSPGIAVIASGNDVDLYLGNGAGAFSRPVQISLPGAGSIAIGDVNGDGLPDLVSSGGYILFGTSNGGLPKPKDYPVLNPSGSYGLILSKLRENGLTDIVTYGSVGISVLLSLGKGKYQDGFWTTIPGGAGCGVIADFNRDGKPDLAINNGEEVAILLGTGKAASPFMLAQTISLPGAGCLSSGDLNGDGITDLVVPANGAVVSYLGKGDGTFVLKSTRATASGGFLVLADFNHDGKLDFATSGNVLSLGNGDGTFRTPIALVSNAPVSGFSNIAVGDINNDGWPDVVLTNAGLDPYTNLYVLLNDRVGGFQQVPTTFGALTTQAILSDLNADGNLDLVLCTIGGAQVYLGDGTGSFTYQVSLVDPVSGAPGFNMVADLNGDGIPDIAVLGSDTTAVFLGMGGGFYAAPFDLGTGPTPEDLLTANLHGQPASVSLPDIIIPDASGGVMVLINKTK